jgi:hypothetical protein
MSMVGGLGGESARRYLLVGLVTPTLLIYDGIPALLFVIIVHSTLKEKVVPISFAVTVLVVESHNHAFAQI